MNDQEINIAIAEHCGWKVHPKDKWVMIPPNSPHSVQPLHTLPKYCADLNAMAEVEKGMNPLQQSRYAELLGDSSTFERGEYPTFSFVTRTAAQRAEAFLRTIGKWKEAAK